MSCWQHCVQSDFPRLKSYVFLLNDKLLPRDYLLDRAKFGEFFRSFLNFPKSCMLVIQPNQAYKKFLKNIISYGRTAVFVETNPLYQKMPYLGI